MSGPLSRALRNVGLLAGLAPLAGCGYPVVLAPGGDVALQERNVLLASVGLMLLIIIPVMVMIAMFAWRYRASNTQADYDPHFHHSTALEVAIWSAPLTIIVALGALTWLSTHTLDPYRPVSRVSAEQPVAPGVKPLRVQVAALDWKWLFIYPDLGIATVNELEAPLGVPLEFQITSSHMMNSFEIPAMAGQIYAMPGMVTQMHAVMNKPGVYNGFSANYTGEGFSYMNFPFRAVPQAAFDGWVAKVRGGGGSLDRDGYLTLEKPSVREPVHEYARVEPSLFNLIANECADPQEMCVSQMMKIDAKGGVAPEDHSEMMTKNLHGGAGGQTGDGMPMAPPSRRMPVNPNTREPNAGRPTPPSAVGAQ